MRQEKQFLLDEVSEQIQANDSFLIMSYLKLSANAANKLRGEMEQLGGSVGVLRKRLLLRAAQAAGVELDLAQLEGHIGIIFGGHDPLETTKAVFKFSKENDKTIQVIGGRFDGKMYSGPEVEKLSNLPSKAQMQAEFLSVLEAPMAQFLAVQEALLTSVLFCLENKSKQGSES